jgi:hypothetical protein
VAVNQVYQVALGERTTVNELYVALCHWCRSDRISTTSSRNIETFSRATSATAKRMSAAPLQCMHMR